MSEEIQRLRKQAQRIRELVLKTIGEAGVGHSGGSLSVVEILTSLYFHTMRYDPANPKWEDRDRFVLSKGHACPPLYSCLAELGVFPHEKLKEFDKAGGMLQGHPDMHKTPGIEISSGSLGQGLSAGIGMALGARLLKKDFRVYVVLGDGEMQEGQVWEALMFAGFHKIDNLTGIIDYNKVQLQNTTEATMNIEPLEARLQSFGWHTINVSDGNDVGQLVPALDVAKATKGKPTMVIANTVKGKGVSFMENKWQWHGLAPNKEQLEQALKEVKGEE